MIQAGTNVTEQTTSAPAISDALSATEGHVQVFRHITLCIIFTLNFFLLLQQACVLHACVCCKIIVTMSETSHLL